MHRSRHHSASAGFTLVELMVAMVLGLIVIGAVLALVLSMIRANNETIQATRLTQELRATAAVITSELQRAGSSANPFNLTQTAALGAIDTATAGCIVYNYSNTAGTTINRAISLRGDAVFLGTTACGSGGTQLSSDDVSITGLQFTRSGRALTVNLTGATTLASGTTVSRSYAQTIYAPGLSGT